MQQFSEHVEGVQQQRADDCLGSQSNQIPVFIHKYLYKHLKKLHLSIHMQQPFDIFLPRSMNAKGVHSISKTGTSQSHVRECACTALSKKCTILQAVNRRGLFAESYSRSRHSH